jgi:hypothetical protein
MKRSRGHDEHFNIDLNGIAEYEQERRQKRQEMRQALDQLLNAA